MNDTAMKITEQCTNDDAYEEMVLDTIKRCTTHFKTNTSIQNRGGFVLKAIQNDYYKTERLEEKKKAELLTKEKEAAALEKEIATLVETGKREFEAFRKPKLQEIKAQYLTDEVTQLAIAEYAPGEILYRKVLDNFLAGKKTKILQKWIDDYLVKTYLDHEYKNLDRFLAKNYSLEKIDGRYQLVD